MSAKRINMWVPNLEVAGEGGRRLHDINSKLLLGEEEEKESYSASSVYVFSTRREARAAMVMEWLVFWSEHGPRPSVFCRYMKTDDVLEKQVNSLARTFIHTQSS